MKFYRTTQILGSTRISYLKQCIKQLLVFWFLGHDVMTMVHHYAVYPWKKMLPTTSSVQINATLLRPKHQENLNHYDSWRIQENAIV